MNRIHRILLFLGVLFLSCSCIKEQLETIYSAQESQIDNYITRLLEKDPSYTVTHNKGSNRITLTPGSGEEAGAAASVTFHYAVYRFNGSLSPSNLLDTNDEATAEAAGWTLTGKTFEPFTANLEDKDLLAGLKNGLTGVRNGEECEIVFSGKYGYGNKIANTLLKNEALLYHIKVTGVVNK